MADAGIAEFPRGGAGPGAHSGLAILSQPDWRAGMWRGFARNLMPPDAVYDLVNFLFSDEWSLFKRGGSSYKSNAAFGTRLPFLWDGVLAGGQRTVLGRPSSFGVLDVDDATPIDLGGSGAALPVQAAGLGGVLFIGNGAIYAGSRKAAGYSTGTIAIDFVTGKVIGTGTSWNANVDPGMLLTYAGCDRYFPVKSVEDNTHLTLGAKGAVGTVLVGQVTLPAGTLTVKSTSGFAAAGTLAIAGNVVAYTGKTGTTFTGCTGGTDVVADGMTVEQLTVTGLTYATVPLGATSLSGSQYRTSEFLAVAGRRIISVEGDTIRFSHRDDPHQFDTNDFHKLPAGPSGIGCAGIGDTALIFTTQGLYTLTGLINPIVDQNGNPGHRLQLFSGDLVLWANTGLAQSGGQVIAPCLDDIYLLDGRSAPERLSISISKLYREYVAAGHRPGLAAVYRSHYFLPILDQSNVLVDTLVCRLDRPAWRGRHIPLTWPWSRIAGHAAKQAAYAARLDSTTRLPDLLGGGLDGRVASLKGLFAPAAANKLDADGKAPLMQIVTRDYEPMGGNLCHTVKARLRYELVDAASDNPMIQAFLSGGTVHAGAATYGSAIYGVSFYAGSSLLGEFTLLPGEAPEDDGRNPYPWTFAKRARFVRFLFQMEDPAASLVLRQLDVFYRPAGRPR